MENRNLLSSALLIFYLLAALESFAAEWSIGIYEGASPLELAPSPSTPNPVLTARDVLDIQADFVADPFLIRKNDSFYLFFEVLNHSTNQGDIGYATSNNGLDWTYQKIVLNEPFHLSYPYVFEWQGDYYMVPETYQANSIRLYRAVNFPTTWALAATLVTGRPYVDSSPFYYNGVWWMFAATTDNGTLYLFYADKLTGPWVEHPRSPVVKGNSHIARPGGRVLQFDGRLLRAAQDDFPTYGNQIRAFEITTLSKFDYAEFEIPESPLLSATGSGWNADGMHQLDALRLPSGRWLAAVDGIGDPNGFQAPNGVINTPNGAQSILVGQSVTFTGTGTDPEPNLPLTHRWTFGAGSGIADATVEDPGPRTFNNPGVFTVTYTVTDGLGLADPTPATVQVRVNPVTGPPPLDRSGWVVWVDSEETVGENGQGTNVKDGLSSTIWHTRWSGSVAPPHPHHLVVDLGAVATLQGVRALPRQNSPNGRIGQYELYVKSNSSTPPTNPPVPGEWTLVAAGTFPNTASEQQVLFGAVNSRYVWLRALSEAQGLNNPWTSLAEFNVLGTYGGGITNQPPNGIINTPNGAQSILVGQSVTFTGTGTDPEPNLPLTHRWTFGAGSGIADATVEDPGPRTFNNPGVFTVTLTVTDARDLADPTPATRTITVTTLRAPTLYDLNGDGTADLLWRNTSTTVVAAWLMNGTTISATGIIGGVPSVWKIEGIGDVSGDDKTDVIWRNSTNGVVAVWLMNGLAISSRGFPGNASTDWKMKGVGDVDGDGKADLVWQNDTSHVVAIWLMNGTTMASTAFHGGVPSEWEIEQVGDVNGDGKADVVWQHTNGTVTVWVMNGTVIESVGFPGGVSPEWKIQP